MVTKIPTACRMIIFHKFGCKDNNNFNPNMDKQEPTEKHITFYFLPNGPVPSKTFAYHFRKEGCTAYRRGQDKAMEKPFKDRIKANASSIILFL